MGSKSCEYSRILGVKISEHMEFTALQKRPNIGFELKDLNPRFVIFRFDQTIEYQEKVNL